MQQPRPATWGAVLRVVAMAIPVGFVTTLYIWMSELFMNDLPGAGTVTGMLLDTTLAALLVGAIAALGRQTRGARVVAVAVPVAMFYVPLGLVLVTDALYLGDGGGYDAMSAGDVRSTGAFVLTVALVAGVSVAVAVLNSTTSSRRPQPAPR